LRGPFWEKNPWGGDGRPKARGCVPGPSEGVPEPGAGGRVKGQGVGVWVGG